MTFLCLIKFKLSFRNIKTSNLKLFKYSFVTIHFSGAWEFGCGGGVLFFLCSLFAHNLKGAKDHHLMTSTTLDYGINCTVRTTLYRIISFNYKAYRTSKLLNIPFSITVPSPQGQTLTTSGISNTSSIVDRYPRIRSGRWFPTIKRYSFSNCCGVKPSLVEIRSDLISFLRQSCIRSCSDIVLEHLRRKKKSFWEKVVKPMAEK